MGKVKLILGEMSFEEFEAKCNEVLAMEDDSLDKEMTQEEETVYFEVYDIWLENGGFEVRSKITNNEFGGKINIENIDEFANRTFEELIKWIKEIL